MGREDQERLTTDVKEIVKARKVAYENAKEEVRRAKDFDAPSPNNGRFALSVALNRERLAFKNYQKALLDFNRLLLDGIPPEHYAVFMPDEPD